MKFCKFVGNSYPHISKKNCRFILILHQMALIFPREPIILGIPCKFSSLLPPKQLSTKTISLIISAHKFNYQRTQILNQFHFHLNVFYNKCLQPQIENGIKMKIFNHLFSKNQQTNFYCWTMLCGLQTNVTYIRSDWNSVMLKPGMHSVSCCSR